MVQFRINFELLSNILLCSLELSHLRTRLRSFTDTRPPFVFRNRTCQDEAKLKASAVAVLSHFQ